MKYTHTTLLLAALLLACGPSESTLDATDTTASSLQRRPVQLRYAAARADGSWAGFIELTSFNWQKDVSVVWRTPNSGGRWGPWQVTPARYYESTPAGTELWSFDHVGGGSPVQLSVLYHVNGTDFWDDNGGARYLAEAGDAPGQGTVGLTSPLGPGLEVAVVDARVEANTLTVDAQVRNRAYDKQVTLVYSLDDWRSAKTASATYQYGRGDTERWRVSVPVRATTKVDFALSARQAGSEAWDNNFGRNFTCTAGAYGGWFCAGVVWR